MSNETMWSDFSAGAKGSIKWLVAALGTVMLFILLYSFVLAVVGIIATGILLVAIVMGSSELRKKIFTPNTAKIPRPVIRCGEGVWLRGAFYRYDERIELLFALSAFACFAGLASIFESIQFLQGIRADWYWLAGLVVCILCILAVFGREFSFLLLCIPSIALCLVAIVHCPTDHNNGSPLQTVALLGSQFVGGVAMCRTFWRQYRLARPYPTDLPEIEKQLHAALPTLRLSLRSQIFETHEMTTDVFNQKRADCVAGAVFKTLSRISDAVHRPNPFNSRPANLLSQGEPEGLYTPGRKAP